MMIICNKVDESKRYTLEPVRGMCLEKAGLNIPYGGYVVIDRNAEIQIGDLVHCSRVTGAITTYIKRVSSINGNSITVNTAYADPEKDFSFEAAEIMGVVTEAYERLCGHRIYKRSDVHEQT